LRETRHYRQKEEEGTAPGFYYIWDEG